MNTRTSSPRPGVYALIVVTALLTLAGLVALLAPVGVQRLLERHWAQRLGAMKDEEAAAELERIAALGDASLRPLAAALASPRQHVARSALELLDSKLNGYRQMPVSLAEDKLAEMADALIAESDHFGPTAAQSAAQLAGRIARWRFAGDSTRRGEIIAAAETLLRAAPRAERRPQPALASASRQSDLFDMLATDYAPVAGSLDEDRVFDLVAPVPGGGIRPEPPSDGAGFVAPPEPEPELPAIRFVESDASTTSLHDQTPPQDEPRSHTSSKAALATHQQDGHGDIDESRRVNAAGHRTAKTRQEPPLYKVLRQLASSDEAVSEVAEAELLALGFNDTERWVARRSVDADPAIRRQLAEALPRMTGVNAAPWLLWLSRDEDPRVRREAMAVLATTGDPELRRLVERLADRDRDEDIRTRLGREPEHDNVRR